MTGRERELQALYAELPELDCIGSCWDSCGRIGMTGLEHRRTEAAGVAIPEGRITDPPAVCPALTMLHQCSVYDVRPLICRLWGVTDTLPCPFGCRPKDGRAMLTDEQAYEYMARVYDIAGEHRRAEEIRRPWRDHPDQARQVMAEMRRANEDTNLAAAVRRRRLVESGKPVLFVRGRGHLSSTPPTSGANS
jgi:hypothetical protein